MDAHLALHMCAFSRWFACSCSLFETTLKMPLIGLSIQFNLHYFFFSSLKCCVLWSTRVIVGCGSGNGFVFQGSLDRAPGLWNGREFSAFILRRLRLAFALKVSSAKGQKIWPITTPILSIKTTNKMSHPVVRYCKSMVIVPATAVSQNALSDNRRTRD